MDRFRILLADDHALFRQGLKKILADSAGLEVGAEASDGLELLHLARHVPCDMIILDISMPHMRGLEAIPELKNILPKTKILILTMHKEKDYIERAISVGADGYLLKEDADRELFSAIEKIRQGRIYMSPRLSEELSDDWARIHRGEGKTSTKPEPLSNRERQVLKLIAEGKSNKETADLLFISVRTVERHRANILAKLRAKKTADLVKYAIRKGYI